MRIWAVLLVIGSVGCSGCSGGETPASPDGDLGARPRRGHLVSRPGRWHRGPRPGSAAPAAPPGRGGRARAGCRPRRVHRHAGPGRGGRGDPHHPLRRAERQLLRWLRRGRRRGAHHRRRHLRLPRTEAELPRTLDGRRPGDVPLRESGSSTARSRCSRSPAATGSTERRARMPPRHRPRRTCTSSWPAGRPGSAFRSGVVVARWKSGSGAFGFAMQDPGGAPASGVRVVRSRTSPVPASAPEVGDRVRVTARTSRSGEHLLEL